MLIYKLKAFAGCATTGHFKHGLGCTYKLKQPVVDVIKVFLEEIAEILQKMEIGKKRPF